MIATAKPTPLEFVQRPDRGEEVDTPASTRRIWRSKCGRYRVTESRVPYYAIRYDAQHLDGGCWDVISSHRVRHAAVKACQKHARKAARNPGVASPST